LQFIGARGTAQKIILGKLEDRYPVCRDKNNIAATSSRCRLLPGDDAAAKKSNSYLNEVK